MLGGMRALEIWVEHAVRKDGVRSGGLSACGSKAAPCSVAGVLPEAVDNDAIETRAVGGEPARECGVVPGLLGGAESVDGAGEIGEEGCGGIVDGGDFGFDVRRSVADEGAYDFARATGSGRNSADDVKDTHAWGCAEDSRAEG